MLPRKSLKQTKNQTHDQGSPSDQKSFSLIERHQVNTKFQLCAKRVYTLVREETRCLRVFNCLNLGLLQLCSI